MFISLRYQPFTLVSGVLSSSTLSPTHLHAPLMVISHSTSLTSLHSHVLSMLVMFSCGRAPVFLPCWFFGWLSSLSLFDPLFVTGNQDRRWVFILPFPSFLSCVVSRLGFLSFPSPCFALSVSGWVSPSFPSPVSVVHVLHMHVHISYVTLLCYDPTLLLSFIIIEFGFCLFVSLHLSWVFPRVLSLYSFPLSFVFCLTT